MYKKPLKAYEHGYLQLADDLLYNAARKRNLHLIDSNKCNDSDRKLQFSYYIGIDWLNKYDTAVYVEPKINKDGSQCDYLKMFLSCLHHPDLAYDTENLFEIRFEEPQIEIEQKLDALTPLLVINFLLVLHSIVRKGLKKSYYKVEHNLHGKVKGKILVGQTLKHNIFKNNPLKTYCSYYEFGWNSLENRLLKKTLVFVHRYLSSVNALRNLTQDHRSAVKKIYDYCLPAFEFVADDVDLNEIKTSKFNAFYREYEAGIRLSKLILRRFGYNIQAVEGSAIISVPPFWIDMSKLFELYVLGMLKTRFSNKVKYQFKRHGDIPDYLLDSPDYKMVVDAKYTLDYEEKSYIPDHIRQLSGYARNRSIVRELKADPRQVVDCLIIYPDQKASYGLTENLKAISIDEFIQFYRTPIKLPEMVQQ